MELRLTKPPVASTGMLIRRPVAEVFEAFVDPEITSRFWFTRGSGRLEAGRQVVWEWEPFGLSVPVQVRALEAERRIVVEFPGETEPSAVEWTFAPRGDGSTFVSITHRGFAGDADEMVAQAADSTEGFALVLAALKALLEHGVQLNLAADRHPDGLPGG